MKIKIFTLVTALFLIGNMGCKKFEDFGQTNLNPSGIDAANLGALMANSQSGLGAYASFTRPGLYAQYFSETQYTEVSLYSDPKLPFVASYAGVLTDLQTIIDKNESNNMTQVAKILQQYVFWTITDRWGDVPYSEALKALEKPNPKYDTQEDIYKGMLATLTAAVAAFDNTSIIKGDLIFKGDAPSWKRTANSLRMLMSIQLSKRYPAAGAYAATQFNAALTDPNGYISTNAQNMVLDYPGGNFKSPWYAVYDGRKDYGESKTMTDLMSSLGDPRQNEFGGANQDATAPDAELTSNVGVPYGVKKVTAEAFTSANTNWARILRGDKRKIDSDLTIISAAEVALARAEAADLGWTAENLNTVYNNGIALSFEQWGEPLPGGYTSQASVALGVAGTASNIQKIATQRYIASYPDGLQAWNIWRKTGFPVLLPAPDATSSPKVIPRRYTYDSAEYTSNKASVEAAVALLVGGDKQDSRVWWDN